MRKQKILLLPPVAFPAAGCGHGGGDTKAEAKDPQTPTVQVAAVTRGTLERLTPATAAEAHPTTSGGSAGASHGP